MAYSPPPILLRPMPLDHPPPARLRVRLRLPPIASQPPSYASPTIDPSAPGSSRGRITARGQPRKKRKRQGSDTEESDYSPTLSMRGGGKPPKPKGKRNAATPAPQHSSTPPVQGSRRTTRSKARRADSPSDLMTTSLEDIKMEDASVKSEIARLGLSLRDVQGDGNCLFRCLSDQLYGTEKRHAEMRRLVCDYLASHKDTMEGFVVPFMKTGEGFEGYVSRMRQSKQFGSHIEIQAAARIFRRDIRVVMSTASFTIPWRAEPPSPNDHPPASDDPDEHLAEVLPESVPPPREGRTMLWLALFSQAEHFQSIRRRGDKENGLAAVEDRLAVPHQRDVSEAARRARGELIERDSKDAPQSRSSLVSQVLASLPSGHGITPQQVENVIARVKGNYGEAVEILLEEVDLEVEDGSESSVNDNHRVEEMLRERPSLTMAHSAGSSVPSQEDDLRRRSSYRDPNPRAPSPALTSTTDTRSRSNSLSDDNTREDSVAKSVSSSDTTVSEGSELPSTIQDLTKARPGRLGEDLKGMVLGSREGSSVSESKAAPASSRRESLRPRSKM
ncbi:hypothetical protein L198_00738 [Cryptococcus wingfieldii CBS 7118]|uniref:OTU domain-containing protein n=1 Tax=Cryptococcus wingfieldii CBS 7118 TaxID=1295528 RepID=A0A1E3K2B6_9TREE|nr:hypothetical protein L198_00738 [Cryptococcus wingfieldii CBS 7118]ODO07159.1 hypothetical protein L198_00738 [Cryptococcus wingfieldii CBS 7118]